MKKIILASLLALSFTSAWATGVSWSEVKHCDQGYSLVRGESWGSAGNATFFQANISGAALKSIEEQLGEDFVQALQVSTTRFGYFTGKVGALKIEIEEHGSSSVSLNVFDKSGERVADYQFYNCR